MKRAAATACVGGVAALAYAWRVEPHWIQVVRRQLSIANLPQPLIGRTLVQLSDIHAGTNVDENYLISAMQQVSSLKADMIVITGDYITYAGRASIEAIDRVLAHLKPPTLKTIGILGNHDYGRGFADTSVADAVSTTLIARGVHVLRNEVLDVDGLQIAGVDDIWSPRFGPEAPLREIQMDRAALVLCHNPDVADLPVWGDYKGWILCGHTHGGQCAAPLLGPPILPVKNKRYSSGEIDLNDGRRLYINRGLGHLHRVRFNARPEITVFTLSRATV